VIREENAFAGLRNAINKAKEFQQKLCDNRRKFCDDGRPERYKCGEANQRCDTVTIYVICDKDMERQMREGIGPSDRRYKLPPDARGFCGLTLTMNCLGDKDRCCGAWCATCIRAWRQSDLLCSPECPVEVLINAYL